MPRVQEPEGLINGDVLAPFFRALRSLEKGDGRTVRILHFGDSHTAADYWSGRVRKRLQARFGDGGPGLLLPGKPWRGYPHEGVRILDGRDWPAHSLRREDCDGWVGLTGTRLEAEAGASLRIQARFGALRVHLLGAPGQKVFYSLSDTAQGTELPMLSRSMIQEGRALECFGVEGLSPLAPQELILNFPETTQLLGVDLCSGTSGLVYDELGLNGAELLDLERWHPGLRKALLDLVRPDLIILAYGTNEMGKSPEKAVGSLEHARRLLKSLQQASGVPILLVGPLDRLGRAKRQRDALKAGALRVIREMRTLSRELDCAFWDAREAMGGHGAIQTWRRKGLAQKDLVHLTGPGYQRLGDCLVDALTEVMNRPSGKEER